MELSKFTDTQKLTFGPRWSADGKWLRYVSPDPSGLGAINLEDGRTALYPNGMSEPGAWSATGAHLLTTQTWQQGDQAGSHLLVVDVQTGAARQLVEPGDQPAWLP
jgi:Tol biopolymer transport system component